MFIKIFPFFSYKIGSDNRLSENEAVEEIKQLAQQLQKLHDRIPQKSSATNVILTLLDICRTAQQQNAVTGKPQLQYESKKQQSSQETKMLSKNFIDKETNTSFENLVTCCRISDKCDNQSSCNRQNNMNNKKKGRSKCCEVANNSTINCSTNSINFDNLQLQCMCSSDNNSIEDDDGADEEEKHGSCHHASSFRQRLLNFSGASKQDPHQYKRASELVLGASFDTPIYKNNQSYRISKTFDSCDNIYKPISKSNHSLFTESDQKSIPYSYLERPSMKLSHSEDKNLRELKIALSTTLPAANMPPPPPERITTAKTTTKIITAHSTSTSSTTSSKIDKISFSLSTSSTSDALAKQQQKQHVGGDDSKISENKIVIDEQQQFHEKNSIQKDNKIEEDDKEENQITTCDNNNKTTMSNVNNNNNTNNNNSNVSNGNNTASGSRKRKGQEGKLTIDLNDRSKYTEEVSV